MEHQTDFSYIKPLYLFCNIFGVLPPHSFGTQPTPVSLNFKLYTLFHMVTVFAVYVYSSTGRTNYLYDNLDVTVALTDKLAHLVLMILNLLVRITFVFCKSTTIKVFINKAYHISRKNQFRCFTRRSFWVQFAIFNVYMLAIIAYDAYVWTSTVGLSIFRFYIGRSFFYYVCNVVVFVIFESAFLIRDLFKSLNEVLEIGVKGLVVTNGYVLTEFNIKAITTVVYPECDLRRVRKYYNAICDLVDNFNTIYGFTILLVIIFIISYTLNLTNLLIVYAMDSSKNINGSKYGNNLIVLNFLWIVTMLIFASLLAHSCANSICQSENLAAVCFTCLNEIPTIPKTPKE
ncbi:hypothetical protein Zmor_000123 [Zophobas morio]|uniref:Gustatory receptor n=1 Tax=Zophobas morio TaxID=2755281 RepID=A0AA38MQ81_9CUCU|nr:hypothetical protein Zmor_000123 [Zophobas morio]